jgi:hypothetical protein
MRRSQTFATAAPWNIIKNIILILSYLKGRDQLKDLGVDERKILEWLLKEIGSKCVEWIRLAQDSDQWRTPVNTVMNVRVS